MYFYIITCLLWLLYTPLFSEEQQEADPSPPSLVNMTAMPSSVVAGVNVISGDYIEYDEEYHVSGPDPYTIGHTYVSSSLEEGSLGDGWNFIHDHLLEIHQPADILYTRSSLFARDAGEGPGPASLPDAIADNRGTGKNRDSHRKASKPSGPSGPDKKYIFAHLDEPFGGRLTFEGRYTGSKDHPKLNDFNVKTKHSGFTNVCGGAISGQTNIKNIRLHWDKDSDSWQVLLGDGTKRIYKRQWHLSEMKKHTSDRNYAKQHRDYHLVEEIKPSGNVVRYSYNKDHELEWMRCFNKEGQELSYVHCKQKSKGSFARHPSLHTKNSDNLDCDYDFTHLHGKDESGKDLKNSFGVSGINRPGRPYVRFLYDAESENHVRRLERKESEDGNFVEIKYYRPHSNEMGNGDMRSLKRKELQRFNINRVRYLKAPCGPNGRVVRTHAFRYYPNGKKAGYADVLDGENKRARYIWNDERRLVKIKRFNNQDKMEMAEEFVWGKGKFEGHLIATIIYDGTRKPKLARSFSYDRRGNILTETLYGRFAKNAGVIKPGDLGHSTCDKLTTTYTYSKNRFNLKTSECDPDGNYTYYQYVKGTNLLKAKFICEKDKICKREFYQYDQSAILIETISDDGSSSNKNDLSNVTERHITRITPRLHRPHFGEPEIIEEYYYDFDKQDKVLLKKTVNHFSDRGFVERQELFTADNVLAATTIFRHDDVGRITYKQDPSGKVEHFNYDPSGRLKKKTTPNSKVHYFYDVVGRLIREEEQLPDRPLLITYYDYDNLGRKIREIDPQNNETRYEYDALNRVTKITYPDIYDAYGKKISPTKTFEYKQLGTIKIETDENGFKTTTVYNAAGKVFEQHLPDGTSLSCTYDKKGNLVKEIAPNGVEQSMTYDACNRMTSCQMVDDGKTLSRKEFLYNSFHLTEEISPTGESVRYTYDKAGRKITSTLAHPSSTTVQQSSYRYDTLGRLEEELTYHDQDKYYTKKFAYNASDRVISEFVRDDADKAHTYTLFDYDLDGNCKEETVPVSNVLSTTKTEFLAHSLPAKRTDALGHTWFYFYDYYYANSHGQRVCKKTTVDPRGVTEDEIFDTHGNLSEVLRYCPFGSLLSKKELFYDGVGNCTCILEHSIVNGETTKVVKTLCSYGPTNRLEKIVEAADTPEAKTTTYTYNDYGQKKCTIHADGTELYTLYDKKGRVEHFFAQDNSLSYSYSYDANDRILSVTNNLTGQSTARTYNDLGELISETLESGLMLQYAYDDSGRIRNLTLPDCSAVAYDYSPVHLKTVARLSKDNQPLWQHTILERDLCGKPVLIELPKQAGKLSGVHDLLTRTVQLDHQQFSQQITEFDAIGNLLQQSTTDVIGKVDSKYSYDFLSQLTQESGFADHTYAHDSLYDRLQLDDKAYTVNSLHEVLSDSTKEYTYDKRGNRSTDNTKLYHYDALDRLIKVAFQDKSYVTYSYDAFDRRLEKIIYASDGSETNRIRYLYALENEIGAVDAQGTIIELRILGEGLGAEIGASVGIELKGTLYVPLHDTRGNIVCLLDENGGVAESYRYDAFGNETIFEASKNECKKSILDHPWRFSSKRVDEETGLVYFGRRYYDPSLGKWLTMDPLGLKAGPNLYAYVLNNPMTHFDLYGLEAIEIEHMNQLDRLSSSESRVSDNWHSSDLGTSDSASSSHMSVSYQSSYQNNDNERDPWTALKEMIPGFFDDAFEAMDKYSYAVMLMPQPYVKAGGVCLKVIGTGGKIVMKCIRPLPGTVVRYIVNENFLVKQAASTTHAIIQKEFKITSGFVNLASEARTNHIIFGEKPISGGHLWPGQPGKTSFPQSWGPDKIMHYASDVATDPTISWQQITGPIGASLTNNMTPVRFRAIGQREGVKMAAIIEPGGEGIVTAYPIP